MEADEVVVAFATALRRAGVDVPVGSVVTFARALGEVGIASAPPVYWAGRTTLLRRVEDVPAYDQVFDAFWRGRAPLPTAEEPPVAVVLALPADDDAAVEEGDGETITDHVHVVRSSPHETLRHKDFAAYSREEFAEARRLMADLRLAGALRRTRRLTPSRRGRGRPDLRRTIRHALRSGSEPVRRAWLEPGVRPRRVVLLCDVSGSMEPYARALLRFLHAAVAGRPGRVEAFTLGTRLTRITRELTARDPDAAMAKASRAVADWSGGTRIGDGLRAFNDRYGVRGMARGAVIVILSDGWERGDPAVVAEEMTRLRRVAHRIVWVNPLKSTPGYAPLAKGMAAALPFVDDFVEGHSLASLESLVEVIGR